MTNFYNLPIIHPNHSRFSRSDMPQIKDADAFMKFLAARGIRHKKLLKKSHHLLPTQNEINLKLVFKLVLDGLDTVAHPLIIAKDNHVLDGHNRWYAAEILQERAVCIKVDRDIESLMAIAFQFPGTKSASIRQVA